ncbi:hypothetical protein SAMN06272771_5137 [Streptomyces sp. Ag82_O1-12]|uniref:hypothetical protein n=1 Tax=unclassified Streptomyces TaxID=2593676 RepID=UPI000BD879D0|nr:MULTISPECIES: hypothetical protein [unclassified Streptomyces]SMQ18682.1 hypothetical protein SAMN06272771_5137 [Streptomyces sp. Ag82_O1-12]SOD47721.1 hypothetical protein SAMN06272727_5138 [Streptomyces sp. Ag82_G6-1]
MHDMVGRACMAGVVIGVLVTGLTACTADAGGDGDSKGGKGGKAVAKACAGGTFTWSHVTKRDRLTGVSESERLEEGDGSLRNRMRRVYTPKPSVRADGPAPSPAEILFSLGRKIGEIDSDARTLAEAGGDTWSFTDVRLPAPDLDDDRVTPHAAGEFVQYAGVREVSADFRYTCPDGRTVSGHARNWTVDISGITDCDERPDSALAREVARRSCA